MNFNQFVWRNTYRNKHLYLAYFLSTMFAVVVFFTFATFAFHPELRELPNAVMVGMLSAAVVIYGFSFFFVLYSMDIFLQTRKKEFGTFMMQGMSPKQLKKMVFKENLIIGFVATICGILVGTGFAQVILLLSATTLQVELHPHFSILAVGLTFASFMVLFLLISVFIQFRLPRFTLQELLKSDKLGKGEIKASTWKAFLGIILIGIGYGISFWAKGLTVVAVMFPVMILVIAGTKLFFDQFTLFFIQKFKGRKTSFWKKTNMLVFSDLGFRMKDNARAFFLVAIICTVTFSAIGSLFNFQNFIFSMTDAQTQEFSFTGTTEEIEIFSSEFEMDLRLHNIETHSLTFEFLTSSEFTLISEQAYNDLAELMNEAPIQVDNQDAVLVKNPLLNALETDDIQVSNQSLNIVDQVEAKVFSHYQTTVVISDDIYDELTSSLTVNVVKVWEPLGASREQVLAVGQQFLEYYQFTPRTAMEQNLLDFYAPILFVGLFIGVVFFVAAGSFLYFRLFSDIETDIQKFGMIAKVGLTKKELSKMISQQVGVLFFTPIVVALIHGVVALAAMNSIFERQLQVVDIQVLGVFLMIQIIYYICCRWFYFRKVEKAILIKS